MKTLIFIIFLRANSVDGIPKFGCMTPDSFSATHKDFFSKDIVNHSRSNSLSLLDALMEKSEEIGSGSFGRVVSIANKKPPLALKLVQPHSDKHIKAVQDEIEMLKELCEEKFDETSTRLIGCEGKEIAAFKGCVEDGNSVFIFQREAYGTLEEFPIYWRYRKQPPIKRAVMMMRILEKVASLHKKGIVHSDIKPANIVIATSDIKEFELIDLGVAGKEGSAFVGGTPLFYSPEYSNGKKILTPELDVYSTAMTLLDLEAFFSSFVSSTLKKCFKYDLIPSQFIKLTEECHSIVLRDVPNYLQHERSPKVFSEVFQKALAFRKEDRYSSALEFLVDMIDKLYLIPGYKGYIYGLIKRYKEKKEKEGKMNQKLGKNPPSTLRWEEIAIYLGYDTEPPGLLERAAKFFLCGNSIETPKPPSWKKDMPDYLTLYLVKKYGKDVVSAKLGRESEIPTSDKSNPEPQKIQDDKNNENCVPCITDDDEEVEQEGEHQKVKSDFERNQNLKDLFNVRVWAGQFPSETAPQNQQQVI